eukprot:CAMPEP_0172358724 /NCGR_PEP_ID=MMETSP1060-20121228/3018_1 /TAXON_ID=37318 /ORGANISM="Pseudo-nitzschia pungens, Strain cf. cingulata" /LENGTH=255 /DNA_ID=CAMNT_0013080067 /DNA_START=52 /DNA_END=819 /DNA_ORIENTATION=-
MTLSWSSLVVLLLALAADKNRADAFRAATPALVPGAQRCSSSTSTSTSTSTLHATVSVFDTTDPAKREQEMIERTKRLFDDDVKLGLADGGDCLAEDFTFCAAVVGPIGKQAFLDALGSFKLEDSFDINQNRFGYCVSPVQPNRVYYLTSNTATMTKEFMGVTPDKSPNTELILPPECHHVDFDEATGKITEFGFYTVDRQYGNTGGLGGAFGFFYGVGKGLPFREAKPFKKSFRYAFFTWLGDRLSKKNKNKKD